MHVPCQNTSSCSSHRDSDLQLHLRSFLVSTYNNHSCFRESIQQIFFVTSAHLAWPCLQEWYWNCCLTAFLSASLCAVVTWGQAEGYSVTTAAVPAFSFRSALTPMLAGSLKSSSCAFTPLCGPARCDTCILPSAAASIQKPLFKYLSITSSSIFVSVSNFLSFMSFYFTLSIYFWLLVTAKGHTSWNITGLKILWKILKTLPVYSWWNFPTLSVFCIGNTTVSIKSVFSWKLTFIWRTQCLF